MPQTAAGDSRIGNMRGSGPGIQEGEPGRGPARETEPEAKTGRGTRGGCADQEEAEGISRFVDRKDKPGGMQCEEPPSHEGDTDISIERLQACNFHDGHHKDVFRVASMPSVIFDRQERPSNVSCEQDATTSQSRKDSPQVTAPGVIFADKSCVADDFSVHSCKNHTTMFQSRKDSPQVAPGVIFADKSCVVTSDDFCGETDFSLMTSEAGDCD